MAAKCEAFMNYSKYFKGFYKNKYDCQMWNTKGIIDVKEQIWLTDVKYLRLSTHHRYYTNACTVSQVISINKKTKQICLPNKEYISGY